MPHGSAMSDARITLSPDVINEASAWLAKLEERPLTQAEQARLQAWRQQSPQHEVVWQAALEFKGMLGQVPTDLGRRVLGRERTDRRTLLKSLAGLAVMAPVAKFAWDQWPTLSADYRTLAGEQRQVILPDGGQIQLNTATTVDVRFTKHERVLFLHEGEILASTAADPLDRPFSVKTTSGRIRALGTRFSVRTMDTGQTEVRVYEDAVAVSPRQGGNQTRVEAGQALAFDLERAASLRSHQQNAPAWTQGQIISDNMRLEDLIGELARYRAGILRCDPLVANLRISGVFQLKDTDQALDILADTLPVRVSRMTDYWVTVTQ